MNDGIDHRSGEITKIKEELIQTTDPTEIKSELLSDVDIKSLYESARKHNITSKGDWRTLYKTKQVEEERTSGEHKVETITKKEFQSRKSSFENITTTSTYRKGQSLFDDDWKEFINSSKTKEKLFPEEGNKSRNGKAENTFGENAERKLNSKIPEKYKKEGVLQNNNIKENRQKGILNKKEMKDENNYSNNTEEDRHSNSKVTFEMAEPQGEEGEEGEDLESIEGILFYNRNHGQRTKRQSSITDQREADGKSEQHKDDAKKEKHPNWYDKAEELQKEFKLKSKDIEQTIYREAPKNNWQHREDWFAMEKKSEPETLRTDIITPKAKYLTQRRVSFETIDQNIENINKKKPSYIEGRAGIRSISKKEDNQKERDHSTINNWWKSQEKVPEVTIEIVDPKIDRKQNQPQNEEKLKSPQSTTNTASVKNREKPTNAWEIFKKGLFDQTEEPSPEIKIYTSHWEAPRVEKVERINKNISCSLNDIREVKKSPVRRTEYILEEVGDSCRREEQKMFEKLNEIHKMVLKAENTSKIIQSREERHIYQANDKEPKQISQTEHEIKEEEPIKVRTKLANVSKAEMPSKWILITPIKYKICTNTDLQTGMKNCTSELECKVEDTSRMPVPHYKTTATIQRMDRFYDV